MFKSKIFQYCAIAATVVATSGAIVSSNSSLQSQSQLTPQAKVETQTQLGNLDQLAELPDLSNKLAERPNAPDMPSGKILKQLNLSPEQLQKLKATRGRDQTQIRELTQQARQANQELRDLLVGNESNDVIRAKHDQMLNLRQELQKKNFERMLAMREILTPQQRSQLSDLMQKNRKNHMKDRSEQRMENRRDKPDNLRDRSTL